MGKNMVNPEIEILENIRKHIAKRGGDASVVDAVIAEIESLPEEVKSDSVASWVGWLFCWGT